MLWTQDFCGTLSSHLSAEDKAIMSLPWTSAITVELILERSNFLLFSYNLYPVCLFMVNRDMPDWCISLFPEAKFHTMVLGGQCKIIFFLSHNGISSPMEPLSPVSYVLKLNDKLILNGLTTNVETLFIIFALCEAEPLIAERWIPLTKGQ